MKPSSPLADAAVILSLALATACSDSAEPLVPTTLAVGATAVTLNGVGATSPIDVTVLDQNGDELPDVEATFQSRDQGVAEVDGSGLVTAVADGSTAIVVTAESAETEVAITVEADLADGVPVTGLSGAEDSQVFFEIEIAPGEGDGKVLQIRTGSGQGDVDLLVRFGGPPSLSAFDCLGVLDSENSDTPVNSEICSIANPEAGTWHVMLLGFVDYDGVTVEASLKPLTSIEDGIPQTGLSAPRFDFLYFEFEVPEAGGTAVTGARPRPSSIVLGTSPRQAVSRFDLESDRSRSVAALDRQAAGSSLSATTSGGTGNVELFATTSGQIALVFVESVAPECISAGSGNAEECVAEDPAAGSWTFALAGLFESFSDVTFEVVLDP